MKFVIELPFARRLPVEDAVSEPEPVKPIVPPVMEYVPDQDRSVGKLTVAVVVFVTLLLSVIKLYFFLISSIGSLLVGYLIAISSSNFIGS